MVLLKIIPHCGWAAKLFGVAISQAWRIVGGALPLSNSPGFMQW
jgi:hypothetical protein